MKGTWPLTCDYAELAARLRDAKKRIKDPERFCQFFFARDKFGEDVEARSPHARRWDSFGALQLTLGDFFELRQLLRAACPPKETIESVNDEQGHAAVMRMFDRAIAIADSLAQKVKETEE